MNYEKGKESKAQTLFQKKIRIIIIVLTFLYTIWTGTASDFSRLMTTRLHWMRLFWHDDYEMGLIININKWATLINFDNNSSFVYSYHMESKHSISVKLVQIRCDSTHTNKETQHDVIDKRTILLTVPNVICLEERHSSTKHIEARVVLLYCFNWNVAGTNESAQHVHGR